MIIEATSPTRVDLTGGTLDIWPLYAFLGGGYTVNMAINMRSYVRISPRADGRLHIQSEDMGEEATADRLGDLPLEGPLGMVGRALRFFRPAVGLDVYTKSTAPHGSGVGASSALLIALIGALKTLAGETIDREGLIDTAANLEAQVIGIPTGKQDYFPAVYGGVNAIWFGVDGDHVEPLAVGDQILEVLQERLILSFTGESRFSATSNWNMIKAYVENQGETRRNLARISETSTNMRACLMSADLDGFAQLLDEEWENRKRLADGVTTPRIERVMAAAREAGALASKICGAGGGGCMLTFAAPGCAEAVICALEASGAQHIPYRLDREGLLLRTCP